MDHPVILMVPLLQVLAENGIATVAALRLQKPHRIEAVRSDSIPHDSIYVNG